MNGKKRISKKLLSLILAAAVTLSMMPSMALADVQSNATVKTTTQGVQTKVALEDYDTIANTAIVDKYGNPTKIYRIGEFGTTNCKQYFLHGADVEKENAGVANSDHLYANSYGFKYTLKTERVATDYWENYIQEKQDNKNDIQFGVFYSGTQMAWIRTDNVESAVLSRTSLQDRDGNVIMTGKEMMTNFVQQNINGTGQSGGGVGPGRGSDIIFTVPAKTLEANKDYKLVFESGVIAPGATTALDAKIVYNFSTAPIAVTGVTVSPKAKTLTAGKSTTLNAVAAPEDATVKTVTWTSSNNKVAKVKSNGKVTAVSAGKVTIKATTKDGGKTAKASVIVKPRAASLTAKTLNTTTNIVSVKKTKGVTAYKIYRATKKSGKYKLIKTIKSGGNLKFKDTGLTINKAYWYEVKTYKTTGSTKYYGKTSAIKLAIPKVLKMKYTAKANAQSIRSEWKKVPDADGYVLYRSNNNMKNFKKIADRPTNRPLYYISINRPDGTYYCKMRAYKIVKGKKIYGAYSNVVKVKVK